MRTYQSVGLFLAGALMVVFISCRANIPQGVLACENNDQCPKNWICCNAHCYSSDERPECNMPSTDGSIPPEDISDSQMDGALFDQKLDASFTSLINDAFSIEFDDANSQSDSSSYDDACVRLTIYKDEDGDGQGNPDEVTEACEIEDGYVDNGNDCDDSCAVCFSGATEECDEKDNDCDGETDEQLTEVCGSSVGVCKPGVRSCKNGQWSECKDGIEPTDEVCEGSFDEDCDGAVDEGCSCSPNDSTRDCGSDEGVCELGTQRCEDGTWGDCIGGSGPSFEECDDRDNDCDGETDEELTQVCSSDIGECTAGTQTCNGGIWGACSGDIASEEVCDDKDNDCDNQTDEALSRSCSTNTGECASGTETCSHGSWSQCTGTEPTDEICDNKDNDCDDQTDEALSRNCGTSTGECSRGSQTCSSGQWSTCTGVGPVDEICDNKDNDCDGQTDEGVVRSCGTDVGECVSGTQTCSNGSWDACDDTGPDDETCDYKDNDCNGVKDDPCLVDWCNIQWPTSTTTEIATPSEDIFGQIYVAGCTDVSPTEPCDEVSGELGYGPIDSNPVSHPADYQWISAELNDYSEIWHPNEEYRAVITPNESGMFYYVYRFRYFSGPWRYCDLNGAGNSYPFEVGEQGVLTVTE